jgi:hypothetical protein
MTNGPCATTGSVQGLAGKDDDAAPLDGRQLEAIGVVGAVASTLGNLRHRHDMTQSNEAS